MQSLGIGLGISLARRTGGGAAAPSVSLTDSGVDNSDLSVYTFSNKTLGNGNIVIAGVVRAGTAITISSLTVAGNAATVDVTSTNGATSSAFIAHVVNTASTGDVVLTLSGAAARAGIAVFRINNYTQAAPYLTGNAIRAASAGTMSPDLTGAISTGVVIGVAFNGLGPGHRIAAGSQLVGAKTNHAITVDVQAGVTTWPVGLNAGIDTEMEVTGTAVSMASASAAFK